MERSVSGLPRTLDADELVIGSDDRNALVFIPAAEGVHAVITYKREGFEDGQWWVENRSAAGTFLNGEKLVAKLPLSDGDRMTVAGVDIVFSGGELREDHSQARGVKVEVRGVSDVRGGLTILRDVSFNADEGEFVGILGPSGCGKSSVIQRIAGLAGFESGSITINGHSVSQGDKVLRRLVAYLPQNVEDSLHAGLSVREEMACARRIFLAPGEDDAARDAEILKTLDLCKVSNERIGKLSGGQKRRVAIALALLRQPQLLLLDEPTAGLDPATETEVMSHLRRLSRQGRTVICATHVMENIALFDKVLVLAGGEKINGGRTYLGAPEGLLAHFGVSAYPALYARLKDDSCEIDHVDASGRLPAPWDLPASPTRASFVRSVGGYLRRSFLDMRTALLRPVWSLLLQPLLIAIGIKWGCAAMFGEDAGPNGGGVSTVLFCAALSVFWMGLVGNVQGLVRERVPGRCLERLGGVSLARYGIGKFLGMSCSCVVRTFVFSVLFFHLPEIGAEGSSVLLPALAVRGRVFGVLLMVCVLGGLIGLAVSALVRKATSAISAVPVIAILALFFSQPVIGFDMTTRTNYGSAEKVAEWMPCYRAQVYMGVLEDQLVPPNPDKKNGVASGFFALFAVYVVGAVGLAVLGQHWNERSWDGR